MSILAKYNNPQGWITGINLLFCLALSAAYLFQRDYRRALYFFFAFCITVTVTA